MFNLTHEEIDKIRRAQHLKNEAVYVLFKWCGDGKEGEEYLRNMKSKEFENIVYDKIKRDAKFYNEEKKTPSMNPNYWSLNYKWGRWWTWDGHPKHLGENPMIAWIKQQTCRCDCHKKYHH